MNLRLPDDHPLRTARWIWPSSSFELVNCYADFRKDFTLPAAPRTAPFAITADQHYRLWVNGIFVCRGPARGYQRSWPVDEVDLAPYLRKGGNWIAIEAYTPGISTYRYLHQGIAGVLCAGTFGKVEVKSEASWSVRRSPAHLPARRLSQQLDFQEHIDLARLDRRWITDEVFQEVWGEGPYGGNGGGLPGRPPWEDLEGRGIPLLRHALRAPAGVVARAAGTCGDGWRTWNDASWPWQCEAEHLSWTKVADGRLHGDALVVELPAAGPEGFVAAAIDIGEYICGDLLLEVEGGAAGQVLDLHYHEALIDGRPDRRKPGDGCCIALASRLHLTPGRHAHEFYHLLAFSVVTVVARGTVSPLRVSLRVRTAGYPFTMRGCFASSDATLDGIHAACRRTQQLCASDAYVDTPWREQAQWWGDARVQGRNTFYLDGDARLLARGIRSIAGQKGPNGLTYGHAPTMAHHCILPDFSLTWILTIWDHYYQTGETTLLREMWPRVQEVLGYFDNPALRHRSGLLSFDRGLWYFGDWANLYKGEVPTFLNLWYLLTLRQLAILLKAARMPREAASMAKRAKAHEALVTRLLIDRKAGLLVAGLNAPDSPGVHEQTTAIIMGLAPELHRGMLDKRLLPWIRGEKLDGAVPSAFWSTYVFDALGEHGHAAEVVNFIRKNWQPMLATGTTWEGLGWSEKWSGSASHAWTAHPSSHLVNWLVGIRQAAPAWKRIILAPNPVSGIDHAEGMIPTPQGDVNLRWERNNRRISVMAAVPKAIEVEVRMPGAMVERWSGGGRRHWKVPTPT